MSSLPSLSAPQFLATSLEGSELAEALETFFGPVIVNPNTRKAYEESFRDFMTYAVRVHGITRLDAIRPVHIAQWLQAMQERGLSIPSVKQRLSGLNSLLGYLAVRGVIHRNPAIDVNAPRQRACRGKTPVLSEAEWLQLMDAIDTTSLIGLRDRAMIAAMTYSFARISAVTALKVGDVFHQKHRLWLRLTEKGGKVLDLPCNHNLEHDLREWLDAAGHGGDPHAFLFQTLTWARATGEGTEPKDDHDRQQPSEQTSKQSRPKRTRILSGHPMTQAMTWEMLQRRKNRAGLATALTNHTFRATGITTYLSNGGSIEAAKNIAGHASISTTQIYDRRPENVTLEEVERIVFRRV